MVAFAAVKDILSTSIAYPAVFSSPRRALASKVFDCCEEPFRRKESSFAHGVGKDEYALALVARAKFRRAKYSERRRVTQAVQAVDDFSQPQADVPFDVLEEAQSRSEN
jgi:hypothetical protein